MAEGDDFPARALLEAEDRILDEMSDGADLVTTLDHIALLVESLAPPALCSIVALHPDGRHLKPLAAPSLPQAYTAAIDGVEIGPRCGSCGTAMWRKEPVIVADIATDPLWEGPRDFTLSFGLRACWSMPVLSGDGTALSTIAMYYREPRAPTEAEWALLAPGARLVRLALAIDRERRELRINETRWQLAADAGGLGTFVFDFATGIEHWSPRLRKLLGVGDEAPACVETFVKLMVPEDQERFIASMPNPHTKPNNAAGQDIQVRIHRADTGEARVLAAKGRLLLTPDGKPLRVVGTLADITEQHLRERKLAEAKIMAEEANRAKSRFLAAMSHELRTPLNAIIGFSEMMFQGVLGRIEPPQYHEYSALIHKSGTHLLSLINDVLDMAKIEAGKHELHRKPVEAAGLGEGALMFVSTQAQRAGVKLNLEVPRGVVLNVDERAIRQVLTNLLANAVKFTPEGGTVCLFGEQLADGGFALGVADSGIGMDEAGIATALEPFGQIEIDKPADHAGTGLGLPLAKAMIELHGAAFRITSVLGVGTRVWGEFPATDVRPSSDAWLAFG